MASYRQASQLSGVTSIHEPYGPGVRPVYNRPERWNIHGGVQ